MNINRRLTKNSAQSDKVQVNHTMVSLDIGPGAAGCVPAKNRNKMSHRGLTVLGDQPSIDIPIILFP